MLWFDGKSISNIHTGAHFQGEIDLSFLQFARGAPQSMPEAPSGI